MIFTREETDLIVTALDSVYTERMAYINTTKMSLSQAETMAIMAEKYSDLRFKIEKERSRNDG